ncbi:PQQ-dependent sugar dehydrogenase [Parafrankia elaeagni]|uniref:PQQ-dependent sugar dehydrogenase n=1 Tax=Parafrankia elaeagni TaxID=222534 RepID=UPI0003A610EF|nr:PQQ-dependent sugar dehydrogenase [Parafrankia elaeagni]
MHSNLRRLVAPAVVAALLAVSLVAMVRPAQAHPDDPHPEDPAATETASYERILLTRNVGEPIDLAVLPDRRILHTARNGDIRLTDPSTGVTRIVNTIPVYANSEDGLQTVSIDPDFENNHWVYLYYAPPLNTPAGAAPNSLPAGADESYWDQWRGHNQLSRFQWTGDGLDLSTEQVIIQVETQRGQCCHVGGDVGWDADGNLYLATGDNTPASTPGANGYAPNNDAPGMNPGFDSRRGAGNTNDLRGKILRIHVEEDGTYTVPAGNLFAPGTTETRPEIFVMGVRNPFRMDVDAETGSVMWGDYGPDAGTPSAERGPMGLVEWNQTPITTPVNSGWPYCVADSRPYNEWNFETATPGEMFDCNALVNNSRWNTGLAEIGASEGADLYYGDNDTDQPWPELTAFGASGGQGPMGGPIYHFDEANPLTSKLPEHWDGKAFFGEFSQDYIAAFTLGDNNGSVTAIENFLPNAELTAAAQPLWDNPMDLEFGPDGSLYVLEYGDGFFRQNPDAGLYRIDYAPGNLSPQARIAASVTSGQAPLAVEFDAAASFDPEEGALTYEWDFDGDGTYDATGVSASYNYPANGQFFAGLRVTDPEGRIGLASEEITVGNTAPTVALTTPVNGLFFSWGEGIPFQVQITDPEDGTAVTCSRVSWTFGLGHNQHAHPINSGTGCQGTVPTPADAGHGETENVFGVLGVTYRDNGANGIPGATGEAQVILNPRLMEAEHADSSSGVTVTDDETASGLRALTSLDSEDWIAYDPVNFTGVTQLQTRASGSGTLSLRWNAADAEPFATVPVSAGAEWATVATALPTPPTETGQLFVTSSGGVEVDSFTFSDEAIPEPSLNVQVAAETRCIAGRVLPAVTVTNTDEVPVDVSIQTTYGTRDFTGVAPGTNAFHAFTTRLASIPAGSVTVVASATVDATPVSVTTEAAYEARSCG